LMDLSDNRCADLDVIEGKLQNLDASLHELHGKLEFDVTARNQQGSAVEQRIVDIVAKLQASNACVEAVKSDLQAFHVWYGDLKNSVLNCEERFQQVKKKQDIATGECDAVAKTLHGLDKRLKTDRESWNRLTEAHNSILAEVKQNLEDCHRKVGGCADKNEKHAEELDVLRMKVQELSGIKSKEYELRKQQMDSVERRVDHVEKTIKECGELDKSELLALRKDFEEVCARVRHEVAVPQAAQLALERRLHFLEQRVCDSGGKYEKELDVVSIVAQEQLELGAYIATLTKDTRSPKEKVQALLR